MDPKPKYKFYALMERHTHGESYIPLLTIAENEDQALMDFFTSEDSFNIFFFDPCYIRDYITHYGYKHRLELDEQGVVDQSHWSRSVIDPKYSNKMGNWVLQQWGIDVDGIPLFKPELEHGDLSLIDGVFNLIRTKIYELPYEKQLLIARFIMNNYLIGQYIEEKPIDKAIVVNRLSKQYEDEMNQMRADVVKIMRRNVPPELLDIVANYLKL